MFVGLFITVAGAQHALLTPDMLAAAGRLHLDQIPMLSIVTAALSNLVSNVPAVLILRPFIDELHNRDTAWLVVAMASTLAGNFTVLGSIANLIVVQKAAAKRRVDQLLGILQGRRAADAYYPRPGDTVAVAVMMLLPCAKECSQAPWSNPSSASSFRALFQHFHAGKRLKASRPTF